MSHGSWKMNDRGNLRCMYANGIRGGVFWNGESWRWWLESPDERDVDGTELSEEDAIAAADHMAKLWLSNPTGRRHKAQDKEVECG